MRTLVDAWFALVGFLKGTKSGSFQWNGYHYLVFKESRWATHADCYQFDSKGNVIDNAPRPPTDLVMQALDMDVDDPYEGIHWEKDWNRNE